MSAADHVVGSADHVFGSADLTVGSADLVVGAEVKGTAAAGEVSCGVVAGAGAGGGASAASAGNGEGGGSGGAESAFADIATDGPDEVKGVAAIAKRFSNVVGVEILPYHRFGEYKWREMGLRYPLQGMKTPTLETTRRVQRLFEAEGVKVIL